MSPPFRPTTGFSKAEMPRIGVMGGCTARRDLSWVQVFPFLLWASAFIG